MEPFNNDATCLTAPLPPSNSVIHASECVRMQPVNNSSSLSTSTSQSSALNMHPYQRRSSNAAITVQQIRAQEYITKAVTDAEGPHRTELATISTGHGSQKRKQPDASSPVEVSEPSADPPKKSKTSQRPGSNMIQQTLRNTQAVSSNSQYGDYFANELSPTVQSRNPMTILHENDQAPAVIGTFARSHTTQAAAISGVQSVYSTASGPGSFSSRGNSNAPLSSYLGSQNTGHVDEYQQAARSGTTGNPSFGGRHNLPETYRSQIRNSGLSAVENQQADRSNQVRAVQATLRSPGTRSLEESKEIFECKVLPSGQGELVPQPLWSSYWPGPSSQSRPLHDPSPWPRMASTQGGPIQQTHRVVDTQQLLRSQASSTDQNSHLKRNFGEQTNFGGLPSSAASQTDNLPPSRMSPVNLTNAHPRPNHSSNSSKPKQEGKLKQNRKRKRNSKPATPQGIWVEGCPRRNTTDPDHLMDIAINDPERFFREYANDLYDGFLWIIAHKPEYSGRDLLISKVREYHRDEYVHTDKWASTLTKTGTRAVEKFGPLGGDFRHRNTVPIPPGGWPLAQNWRPEPRPPGKAKAIGNKLSTSARSNSAPPPPAPTGGPGLATLNEVRYPNPSNLLQTCPIGPVNELSYPPAHTSTIPTQHRQRAQLSARKLRNAHSRRTYIKNELCEEAFGDEVAWYESGSEGNYYDYLRQADEPDSKNRNLGFLSEDDFNEDADINGIFDDDIDDNTEFRTGIHSQARKVTRSLRKPDRDGDKSEPDLASRPAKKQRLGSNDHTAVSTSLFPLTITATVSGLNSATPRLSSSIPAGPGTDVATETGNGPIKGEEQRQQTFLLTTSNDPIGEVQAQIDVQDVFHGNYWDSVLDDYAGEINALHDDFFGIQTLTAWNSLSASPSLAKSEPSTRKTSSGRR